jgi:hypothetical protein
MLGMLLPVADGTYNRIAALFKASPIAPSLC